MHTIARHVDGLNRAKRTSMAGFGVQEIMLIIILGKTHQAVADISPGSNSGKVQNISDI